MGQISQEDKQQLFDLILEKAFFREKIILSSGKESDYYIDARLITLTATGAFLTGKIMLDIIKGEEYVAVGGPTLGADPLIGAINVLSHQADEMLNTFIIRKAAKSHGKQRQIEGPAIPTGSNVILIDDVATTGKAFVESIAVLEKEDIHVSKAICIVDRGEGAREAVEAKGCELISIFTAEEFLNAS